MRKVYLFIMATLLCFSVDAIAQKKRKTTKKSKAKKETVDNKALERLRSMELATQDIIVIDSVVVNKKSFIQHYKLSDDAGSIMKYSDYNRENTNDTSYVFINEMGDKCYFSEGDTVRMALYTRNLIDNEWEAPTKLDGIDGNIYTSQNYPFMMADGITLYFASNGSESIGGYDIFVTRYDSESNRYFKPDNIGMPFNSTANDYMYAIDEINNIGWFASDRNQPKDTVCIYIFIPAESRTTYSNNKYTEEQIRSLARLERIADTWKDNKQREQALKRLKSINQNASNGNKTAAMQFVINDKITYTGLEQFTVLENVDRFINVQKMKSQLTNFKVDIEKSRRYYPNATDEEKPEMKNKILRDEKAIEALELEIKKAEKEIRNTEIQNLSK